MGRSEERSLPSSHSTLMFWERRNSTSTKGFPPKGSEGLSTKLFLCLLRKEVEEMASDNVTGVKSGAIGLPFLTPSNPEASGLETGMTKAWGSSKNISLGPVS